MFKSGDKVRMLEDCSHLKKGDIATLHKSSDYEWTNGCYRDLWATTPESLQFNTGCSCSGNWELVESDHTVNEGYKNVVNTGIGSKEYEEHKEQIRHFATGAVRDGGSKWDIIEYMSPLALSRYYNHMKKSAKKYGSGNWTRGIPREEYLKSLRRHLWCLDVLEQTGVSPEPETDHLSAIIFNVMGAIHEEEILRLKGMKNGDDYNGYHINLDNIKR